MWLSALGWAMWSARRIPFAAVIGLMLINSAAGAGSVVGSQATEWHFTNWINSKPLTLKDVRGKVALVRWWTAPHCNYCRGTAPALNVFDRKYRDKGLRVIGAYHHKSDAPLDVAKVKQFSEEFGFEFPVAIDPDWQTLREWWLNDHEGDWTSVTFLIDRGGIIRHVHPGGSYVKGDQAYAELESKIETALREGTANRFKRVFQ